MRILVVEDEQDLNRILAKTLTAEGYSVDACFDGVEALDYLEGAEYDAVVLDVMMPRMDDLTLGQGICPARIHDPQPRRCALARAH